MKHPSYVFIDQKFARLFNSSDQDLGPINQTQLLDIQNQIMKGELDEHYIMIKNHKQPINDSIITLVSI